MLCAKSVFIFYSRSVKFKYLVSDKIKNQQGYNYFISAWYLKIKYKLIEIGISNSILSGGYENLQWSLRNAIFLPFTQQNMKYWDKTKFFFIKSTIPESKLTFYIETGFPQQNIQDKMINTPYDHGLGAIIGFRRIGLFNSKLWLILYFISK